MWKRISFLTLSWTYGSRPFNPEECTHDRDKPHDLGCRDSYSGYKAHVYGENMDDVENIMKVVKPLADHYGWGHKAADEPTFDALKYAPEQHGKSVAIYFPNHETWHNEASHLAQALHDSGYRNGEYNQISGDHMVGGNVGWRYELRQQNLGRNVGAQEYHDQYVPNPCNCSDCNPNGEHREGLPSGY